LGPLGTLARRPFVFARPKKKASTAIPKNRTATSHFDCDRVISPEYRAGM
jgi:hypothetical protein